MTEIRTLNNLIQALNYRRATAALSLDAGSRLRHQRELEAQEVTLENEVEDAEFPETRVFLLERLEDCRRSIVETRHTRQLAGIVESIT
tara:strand:- start:81 stop:347 length:267 start_codon:yes stop_codon:yes gene_type:complete